MKNLNSSWNYVVSEVTRKNPLEEMILNRGFEINNIKMWIPLTTLGTQERFFSRMPLAMLFEMPFSIKRLITDFTRERFVTIVHPHVCLQILLRCKTLKSTKTTNLQTLKSERNYKNELKSTRYLFCISNKKQSLDFSTFQNATPCCAFRDVRFLWNSYCICRIDVVCCPYAATYV